MWSKINIGVKRKVYLDKSVNISRYFFIQSQCVLQTMFDGRLTVNLRKLPKVGRENKQSAVYRPTPQDGGLRGPRSINKKQTRCFIPFARGWNDIGREDKRSNYEVNSCLSYAHFHAGKKQKLRHFVGDIIVPFWLTFTKSGHNFRRYDFRRYDFRRYDFRR